MVDTMFKFFSVFLKDAATRFTRIARSAGGHIKPEDLHAEAWIVAAELSEKRGREIDFADPVDQELVLNRIYWKIKDQRDWRLESAYSIDDDREGATPWADRLPAPSSTIPLQILLQQEETAAADARLAACYSQAAAYLVALANFNDDKATLCRHLVISYPALQQREHKAMAIVIRQSSLFDGIEIIDPAFKPAAGRELISKGEIAIAAAQCEMAFD